MPTILVTGGAGYIGSQTAKALAQAGFTPVVLDNLSAGSADVVRWGPLVVGAVNDSALLRKVMDEHRTVGVVHFAASTSVGESMTAPRKYFQNNLVSTLTLLDAMVDSGVRHIVFSSTAAVYGNPQHVPIQEDHPKAPINPYGEGKLFVERALHWYAQAYGLTYTALRYFNAAGADPDGETGERHDPETHLVPLVVQTALGKRPVLDVLGTDYPTRDGTAIRDYVHTADLADAHRLALQRLLGGGASDVFNLGTGNGYTVREVIAAVEKVSGRTVPVRDAPRRAGDPPSLVADPRRAIHPLDWPPRHSDLETIVRTAWLWHSR